MIAAAVSGLLGSLLYANAPASATFPGPVNGRVACSRQYGGTGTDVTRIEVVTMDPDGGNVQRLTNNSVLDFDPIWSPDGREIIFESFREGASPSSSG